MYPYSVPPRIGGKTYPRVPRKPRTPPRGVPGLPQIDFDLAPVTTVNTVAAAPGGGSWLDLIKAEPTYGQDIIDINAGGVGDKTRTMAVLRAALAKYGGGGLADILKNMGGQATGFEDLIDPATLGAAASGDQAGTTVSAQLAKSHRDRLLAEEDIRAAKGILSSGQSGYEIGEERQRDTIAKGDAVQALLEFLGGQFGGFAGRETDRGLARSTAADRAAQRLKDMGISPAPKVPINPAVAAAVYGAAKRKKTPARRRPIGGWE